MFTPPIGATSRYPDPSEGEVRLPAKVRQQLLHGIYAGTPFRTVVRELGLTSQQGWGTDQDRPRVVDRANGSPPCELEHGTNAAYANGCVCGTAGSTSNGEAGTVAVEVCDAEVSSVVSTNAAALF